jgi:ankyrin repeat protein
MVAYLIQKGAQLNGQDAFAGTPLIEAISSGYDAANAGQRLQLVKVLVDHGADVNLGDNRGTTPIAVAALYEHKAIVEYLVQHGAAVNSRGEEGHTAFSFAAYKANQGLCEYFVAFGARPHERLDDGSTAVMHALRSNDVAFLRWLIPQYRYNVQDRDSSGQTLLMYAVQNQGMATTPYVVNELGLDVNARDHRGRTPLMFTAGSLELDKIRFLVEKGSQVNAQDQQGMTTIMHIAENVNFGDSSPPNDAQSYEAIKYLKSRGGRIDIRSKSGRLALDYLQDKPFPELIALLK